MAQRDFMMGVLVGVLIVASVIVFNLLTVDEPVTGAVHSAPAKLDEPLPPPKTSDTASAMVTVNFKNGGAR